ncbi:MAG: hypothetical protein HRT89_16625 [Lentisphaeria bacterium]|nr:hypothetical protein [Lentisphaeria bacterium]NQZ69685.1 hypothetical protein [Lentisphaeria bacterium]
MNLMNILSLRDIKSGPKQKLSPNKVTFDDLMIKKSPFNMIEIVVSLVLILIVLLAAVSLFTTGLTNNKEAFNRSYANDSMDQFIHQMSNRLEQDWTQAEAFPLEKPTSVSNPIWSTSTLITNANYQLHFPTENDATWSPSVHNSGIFKVVQSTNSLGKDFSAEILSWKSETEYGSGDKKPISLMLYAEISWPIHLAYEDRQKTTYQTLIYKPGLLASDQLPIAKDMVCKTVWAIDDSGSRLNYYILTDGYTFSNSEGELEETLDDVEAFTFTSGGIYLIDNGTGSSILYRIDLSLLDLDSSTPVPPTRLGSTGLSGSDKISALQSINGVLYGVTRTSKKIYSLSESDGSATLVRTLNVSGSFTAGGLTTGANGTVYIVKSNADHSAIYSFSPFPNGALSLAATITGSKSVESLAAHPNGMLYAGDSSKWYAIDPSNRGVSVVVNHSSTQEGFDFYYAIESVDCTEEVEEGLTCDYEIPADNQANGNGGWDIVDGVLIIFGGPYSDTLKISDSDPNWKIELKIKDENDNETTIEEYIDMDSVTSMFMCGGDGENTMDLSAFTGDAYVIGGNDYDNIYGGYGNDTIHAGNGDDYIQVSGGDNSIFGEGGDDDIQGGDGDDVIDGGDGDDDIQGGNGENTIINE